jgi:NTP pyrophosphatase (non-canonical NTP hydrolase)
MAAGAGDRLDGVLEEIRAFVAERAWARFHDPKNLAMAVVSEAGELVDVLRWVHSDQADAFCRAPDNRARVSEEAADVGITLLMLCDRIGVDLVGAMRAKIEVNRRNYPVEAVQGSCERPRPRGGEGR